jgi:hypothetical protein
MTLCFTRRDLFEEKIRSGLSPLNAHFPDYNGQPTDVLQSAQYVFQKFIRLLEQRCELGVFQINATDTEHVREVVETVLGDGRSRSPQYRLWDKIADLPEKIADIPPIYRYRYRRNAAARRNSTDSVYPEVAYIYEPPSSDNGDAESGSGFPTMSGGAGGDI